MATRNTDGTRSGTAKAEWSSMVNVGDGSKDGIKNDIRDWLEGPCPSAAVCLLQ